MAGAATDLGEDGGRHANQSALVVGDAQYGCSTRSQSLAAERMCKGVNGLSVENQRFGHALRARARSDLDGDPSFRSSSPSRTLTPSRSSSWAMARATKPERPREPTRLRTASASSPGTLTESLAAD